MTGEGKSSRRGGGGGGGGPNSHEASQTKAVYYYSLLYALITMFRKTHFYSVAEANVDPKIIIGYLIYLLNIW